jgi:hypothetical protein
MLKEAIQYIVGLAEPKLLEIAGEQWVDKAVQAPPEYLADVLTLSTLQGVVDYLTENRDGLDLSKLTIHVESPTAVAVLGPIVGRRRKREQYLQAKPLLPDVKLGQWIGREAMSIQLQAMFSPSEDLAGLLLIVGNMEAGETRTHTDDGMSQTVATRKHVGTLERTLVKRVVGLSPFRTFQEVVQPESDFVFRVRDVEGVLSVALYEADGGAWRREAVEAIADWLAEQLKTVPAAPAIIR